MKDIWLLVRKNDEQYGRAGDVLGYYQGIGGLRGARIRRTQLGRPKYDIVKVTAVELVDMSEYDKEKP